MPTYLVTRKSDGQPVYEYQHSEPLDMDLFPFADYDHVEQVEAPPPPQTVFGGRRTLTKLDFITLLGMPAYIAITALAVLVGCVLIFMVYSFSGVSAGHARIEAIVTDSAARLEALENNKVKATARRFTADDAEQLMRCLRIPNLTKEREECLRVIEQQINNR